jgi:hypothetical protein
MTAVAVAVADHWEIDELVTIHHRCDSFAILVLENRCDVHFASCDIL